MEDLILISMPFPSWIKESIRILGDEEGGVDKAEEQMGEETEETKGDSTAPEKYIDYILKVMRENEEFLHNNGEVCDEVIELINDAIDYVRLTVKKTGDYAKYSMAFFLFHILMPFSYAIYTDLLTGNIPVCFMELRLMLESLVKCYLADLTYPGQAFFQEKLELLERENPSISKHMKELGKHLGLDYISLWGKLSQNWIHTRGITDKIVGQVIVKSDVPPWALAIPMNYTGNDSGMLNELRNCISQFRSLLTATIERYQQPTTALLGKGGSEL